MKFRHVFDPIVNFLYILFCVLYWFDWNICRLNNNCFLELNILHRQETFIRAIQSRFIDDSNTEIFFFSIRLRHLKKGIDLSNCWDIVRNKRFKTSLKLYMLRFESRDVFKQFFHILINFEIRIIGGIISSWRCFWFLVLLISIIRTRLSSSWFRNMHVMLIFFRINVLWIIDLHSFIKRLVFNLLCLLKWVIVILLGLVLLDCRFIFIIIILLVKVKHLLILLSFWVHTKVIFISHHVSTVFRHLFYI